MGWILDVVLILFIVLGVLLGVWRGFFGSLAKLLGRTLRLVLSVLLAKPVVALLSLTNINEHMFDSVYLKVSGMSEKFNVNIVGMDADKLKSFTSDALADADIPRMFRSLFLNAFNVSPETIASRSSVTLAEMITVTVVNVILLLISFILVFVLLWLISKLLLVWSKRNVKQKTILAKTNRWLGGVFGMLKSLLILFIGFVLISLLSSFGFMQSTVNFINSSFVSRMLYKLSSILINSSFDLKEMLINWL